MWCLVVPSGRLASVRAWIAQGVKGIAAAGEATDFEDALSWAELQKDVDSMLSEHVDDIHTETFNGTPYGLFQAMFHATAVRMDGDRILSE